MKKDLPGKKVYLLKNNLYTVKSVQLLTMDYTRV